MISVQRSPEEFLSWNEVQTTWSTFLLYYNRYRAGAFVNLPLSIVTVSLIVLPRHIHSLQILFRQGQLRPTGLPYRFLSVGNPPLPSYRIIFYQIETGEHVHQFPNFRIIGNHPSQKVLHDVVYFLKVLQCTLSN